MRFTIRDLLWLTVVVTLGVTWFAEHQRLVAALAENQQVQKLAKEQAEKADRDLEYMQEMFRRNNQAIERQLAEFDLEVRFPMTGRPPVVQRSQGTPFPFTPGRPGPIK